MKIPDEVLALITAEQVRQGSFVPTDLSSYLKKLEDNAELVVHYQPDGCAGFLFFYCNDPEKQSSYITLVMTAPNARKRGIGSSLIKCVLDISKQRGFKYCQLEAKKNNVAALNLYKAHGFIFVEDRGDKYLMKAEIG
jgi:ribosomal-protein-alanine N-acetyltransferase